MASTFFTKAEAAMNRHLLRPFLVSGLAACALMTAAAAERRDITEKDLFKFVWVADPQISPDGSRVAFVRVTVDEKKDQYDPSVWLALSDGSEAPRAFTSGLRDMSPRWSPDGRSLAFTRVTEKDGKPQPPQIFVMSMTGGEPKAITDIPKGAGNPAWSPDGHTIAFSSAAKPADLTPKAAAGDKPADPPRQSDVRVITSAAYRANGVAVSGFVDSDRPSQIWSVAVPVSGAAPPAPESIT